jgi:hypothetical protein
VFVADDELVMIIGKTSKELDALLFDSGVSSAAFLTAWNPRSEVLSPGENALLQAQLTTELSAAGLNFLPGEGRDPAGIWEPEQSLLLLGAKRAAAARLAMKYGQNAYVWLQLGEPAELVLMEL